jgi:hypothetical protein
VWSPSRRAVRTESDTVSTTPLHVMTHAETVAAPTKTATGVVSSSVRVVAAATALTPAHRYVSRRNNCTIAGRRWTSGLIGQKSAAKRAMSGRPTSTERANRAEVATVRMIG